MDKNNSMVKAYLEECSSALLYQTMSEVEKDPRIAEVYSRISKTEIEHAEYWKKQVAEKGFPFADYKPDWRTRTLVKLGKRFGTGMILPVLQGMEQTGSVGYGRVPGASAMQAQEQSHGRLLDQITGTITGGMTGGVLMQLEGRHRSTGGNALRAAVLGANDGLVSNLSLVMGVAGATLAGKGVLIAGVAGLLAGAISMALGEWLSVQSSRELYAHQIATEAEEIQTSPEEETEELALIYEARGFDKATARELADKVLSNQETALDTLAREELGINPEDLGGSAWEAAITSFVLFAIGAIIPVAPFLFTSGMPAVFISIGLSTIGLFILGAVITLFTGRTVLFSGFRMVLFGLIAAAVTFGIGRLIGVSIGG
ncbi:MAG: rubrerythrin family protein [Chloroflexi bacterium HGW-Chloroflexi-4]|nr:MAG: rubrerythrin family protein [Chloroflexi bacterium HGW-Chloroflexi-4]